MKLLKVVLISCAIFCFCASSGVFADDKPIKKGDPFPDVLLPAPDNPIYQQELGVTKAGAFRIQDINADIVVIQIFHSG